MKKTLVCVFAHPDDEAFGPAGTIAKYAKTHDVYILCATKGEAGNCDDPEILAEIASYRAQELIKSAEVLGVKQVYFLDFIDGTLSNNKYHEIAAGIQKYLEKVKPEILMTYEPHGISGHLDHIAISMITTYVFYKLDFVKKLLYHCVTEERSKQMKDYFIYFPRGYKKSEIDEIVDISTLWDKKLKAMHCHVSQKHDLDRILKQTENFPKEEYFLVLKK